MKSMLLIEGVGKYSDLVYFIIIFNTRAVRDKVKVTKLYDTKVIQCEGYTVAQHLYNHTIVIQ